jgi:hypothetical protein
MPPQQGPQGALNMPPQAMIQARMIQIAKEWSQMMEVLARVPGLNQDQFNKGRQAIGIGMQMIAESLPQSGR